MVKKLEPGSLLRRAKELSASARQKRQEREAEAERQRVAKWEFEEARVARGVIKFIPSLIEKVADDPKAACQCLMLELSFGDFGDGPTSRLQHNCNVKEFKGAAAILRDWAEGEGFGVRVGVWKEGRKSHHGLFLTWIPSF